MYVNRFAPNSKAPQKELQAKLDDDTIIYCGCSFAKGGKLYYYRTDNTTIAVGDIARVPIGNADAKITVTVEKVEYN